MANVPITIHLGSQTRELKVTSKAARVAQRLLDGKDPRMQLAVNRGVDTVLCCAAAALMHELGDKADPNRVGKWVDLEPAKYAEIESKVLEAFRRYYIALGIVDEDEGEEAKPGEAESPQDQSP